MWLVKYGSVFLTGKSTHNIDCITNLQKKCLKVSRLIRDFTLKIIFDCGAFVIASDSPQWPHPQKTILEFEKSTYYLKITMHHEKM